LAQKFWRHPLSPISKRGLYALAAVVIVMTVGTVGTRLLTGWAWIDSFYFMSMVATAQGPPNAPPNFWSKIFISVMAFISIGTLVTGVATIFGPFMGYLFHKGVQYADEQERMAAEKVKEVVKKP